jgi:hypothetical protein
VANVVVELELVVVDPHCVVHQWDVTHTLPIAGDQAESRPDVRPNPFDVDPTVRSRDGSYFEDGRNRDVHVRRRRLEGEERSVQSR